MKKKSVCNDDFSAVIGAQVANLRKERNLSGKQLGDLIGVSQQQISRYEQGKCQITMPTLFLILCSMGVSSENFFYLLETRLKKYNPSLFADYYVLFGVNKLNANNVLGFNRSLSSS